MELRIQFVGDYDPELRREAEALQHKLEGLEVIVSSRPPYGTLCSPPPYAWFQGQTHIHEYGPEAVRRLIRDVSDGNVR